MGSVMVPSAALASLAGVDLAVASPVECAAVLSNSRLVRGWIDAVEAQATSRLTEHHAAGQSAPAADTHTKCGGVSAAEARRKERRSKTIKDAPQFGDALAGGDIGAEHIDQLAAATAKLDDVVKGALFDDEDDLLDAARSQTPEQFGQTVRDRARTLEADHGIERNKRQRKQTFISHRVDAETGMHEGRFAFHPELGARIFSAIDRQVLKNIKAGTKRGEPEFVDRTFDYGQQAAEALGDIVSKANSNLETMTARGLVVNQNVCGEASNDDGNDARNDGRNDGRDDGRVDGRVDDRVDARNDARDDSDGRAARVPDAVDPNRSHSNQSDDLTESAAPCGDVARVDAVDDDLPDQSDVPCETCETATRDGRGATVDGPDASRAIEADITVIVDWVTLTTGQFHDHSVCETSYGSVLPPASVQRLICNGSVTPVFLDASGNPFNLGRTVRHANRKQRRALRAIYRSCGFPGCDVGFWKCEIHHILAWELGGLTDLAYLIPICSRHHHVIHEGGWQLHLAPDRTLTVTQPNGCVYGTGTPDVKPFGPFHRPRRADRTSPTEATPSPLQQQPAQLAQPAQPNHSRPRSPGRLDRDCEQMNLLAG